MAEKKITLAEGYTDSDGKAHRDVVISKRPKGSDLFALDAMPESSIATQHNLLVLAHGITKFGDLTMPVPLQVLIDLDEFDIDDLSEANDEFLIESSGARETNFLSESDVQLAFGYSREGVTYDRVRFGKARTGRDLVEADRRGYTGLKRECYLIGRQIVLLASNDGQQLDGPLDIQAFESLDGTDILALRLAAARWRNFFRGKRREVQERVGADGVRADEGTAPDGGDDTVVAG